MTASVLLAGLAAVQLSAVQGEALRLSYPHEPELASVEVAWAGKTVPLARQNDRWVTLIGVDLEAAPGAHGVQLTFRYQDGRSRLERATVAVRRGEFPMTRLTVEPRYVELSPEDQARAARESAEIDAVYERITPEALWSEPFQVPVTGATDGRNFGHRRVFNDQPRAPHSGADLRAGTGTAIHAANRGRVVLAKELFFSGNAVFLDHGLGVYSTYLHLSEILVEAGDLVERGQVIGRAGATGRVTGPHLHWGVRVLDARVDPFSLLELGIERTHIE